MAWAALARADGCGECRHWSHHFEWSDCGTGGPCGCTCAEPVPFGGYDTGAPFVCADPSPPRTDADCVLVSVSCADAPCDPDPSVAADTGEPGERGCDHRGGAGWSVVAVLAIRRRRRVDHGAEG